MSTVLVSALIGCTDSGQDLLPSELDNDGKADVGEWSDASPEKHGLIGCGQTVLARLTYTESGHMWDFVTAAPVRPLVVETGSPHSPPGPQVDTIVGVYRGTPNPRVPSETFWRLVDSNDDREDSVWSRLQISFLEAGRYRVLVRAASGYDVPVEGDFALSLRCDE